MRRDGRESSLRGEGGDVTPGWVMRHWRAVLFLQKGREVLREELTERVWVSLGNHLFWIEAGAVDGINGPLRTDVSEILDACRDAGS